MKNCFQKKLFENSLLAAATPQFAHVGKLCRIQFFHSPSESCMGCTVCGTVHIQLLESFGICLCLDIDSGRWFSFRFIRSGGCRWCHRRTLGGRWPGGIWLWAINPQRRRLSNLRRWRLPTPCILNLLHPWSAWLRLCIQWESIQEMRRQNSNHRSHLGILEHMLKMRKRLHQVSHGVGLIHFMHLRSRWAQPDKHELMFPNKNCFKIFSKLFLEKV